MEDGFHACDGRLGEEGVEEFFAGFGCWEGFLGLEGAVEEEVVVPDAGEGCADAEDSMCVAISMACLVEKDVLLKKETWVVLTEHSLRSLRYAARSAGSLLSFRILRAALEDVLLVLNL